MMQMVHSRFNALLSACVLSLIATAGWSQSITWLGTLGGNSSEARGVSADGRVVVGWAANTAGNRRAFRWTASGGMQDFGTLGGSSSAAYGVSADGLVVVGYAQNSAGQWRAFSSSAVGGMGDLGTLGGSSSAAWGVSADGRVVVGGAYDGVGRENAVLWRPFIENLRTLGGDESSARGVSANGVVVGWAQNAAGQQRAFRWQNGVMRDLGTLPSGGNSWANAVSADGAVVVGVAWNAAGQLRAVRWTASGGIQDLGTLGGTWSEAYGVSADGSVVVGVAENAAGQWRAVRWTASGIEDLNTTYASLLTNGSVLSHAYAISPNGRYIVGQGRNAATNRTEAFLLDTQGTPPCTLDGDVNGDGRVDDADLLTVLFNFGNRCR